MFLVAYFLIFISFVYCEEYCNYEIFNPNCLENEVILVREAYYGRKKYGKCLAEEGPLDQDLLGISGYLNCYSDVKSLVGGGCSGRRRCEITVAHIIIDTKCKKTFKSYLETHHTCIKIFPDNRNCFLKVGSERQHIFGVTNKTEACGKKEKVWNLESMVGQRINISLLQLTWPLGSPSCDHCLHMRIGLLGSKYDCNPYAVVLDKNKKQQVLVCHSNNSRGGIYSFLSGSNNVEVKLMEKKYDGLGFLFAIEATGCSDIIPPSDAYFKRDASGMEATIGCFETRVSWTLKCFGKKWKGVIGNCSIGHKQIQPHPVTLSPRFKNKTENIFPLIIIFSGGFLVCFVIILTGILLYRHYSKLKAVTLKQMNTIYNNSVKLANPVLYQETKPLANGRREPFQESTQYFELDQALVKNNINDNIENNNDNNESSYNN